jgi:superfamily II RNA helicase
MKNPGIFEDMLAITNKYAMVEEAALDTREQKKEKESGHPDQPSSSKGHDKKRNVDRSMNNVEQSCRNKEYRPRPSDFEGFVDVSYAALQAHEIVNVALHREYSPGIVFIFFPREEGSLSCLRLTRGVTNTHTLVLQVLRVS